MQEIPQEKTIEELRENASDALENKLRSGTGKQILVIKRDTNQSSWRRGIMKGYDIDKNSWQVNIRTDGCFWDDGVYHSRNILENTHIDDIDQKLKQLYENKTAEALMDDESQVKSIDIYIGDGVEIFEKTIKNLLENIYLLEDRQNNTEDSHAPFEMMELLKNADEMHLEECPWIFEIYDTKINVSDYISKLKKIYSSDNYFGQD